MNVKLLRRVQKQILAEPAQVIMSNWFTHRDEWARPIPKCGTAGCIAGWTIALSKRTTLRQADRLVKEMNITPFELATELLKLTTPQAKRLFNEFRWPMKWLQKLHYAAEQSPERARVIADYIDAFIKSKGKNKPAS